MCREFLMLPSISSSQMSCVAFVTADVAAGLVRDEKVKRGGMNDYALQVMLPLVGLMIITMVIRRWLAY